jgi:hypothetical protein
VLHGLLHEARDHDRGDDGKSRPRPLSFAFYLNFQHAHEIAMKTSPLRAAGVRLSPVES